MLGLLQIIIALLFLFTGCSKQEVPVKKGEPEVIVVIEREIKVNGKTATMFGILSPGDQFGLRLTKGQEFSYPVFNASSFPTSLHWHGLILPNSQDGAACITQPPIKPEETYPYRFKVVQSGTFWMHSHFGLQVQQLLSAPIIIKDPDEANFDFQDVIMFLNDFTFKYPQAILNELKQGNGKMDHSMNHSDAMTDLFDVKYDAFLTNYRTLSDFELVKVQPGKTVRLRVIDGSASTNFFLDLGALKGRAIAADGNPLQPLEASKFEIAVAQRLDILIDIPSSGGVFPILAQGEGSNLQTGFVLSTQANPIITISQQANQTAGAIGYSLEKKMQSLRSLSPQKVDRTLTVNLGGSMSNYIWTINNQVWPDARALKVKKGERVEIVFNNLTSMSHPMHLHGHVFQVTEIDGQVLSGAMRDTVLVLPHSKVKVQFDADNPGVWPLHCHNIYHQMAGMMTTLLYEDFDPPHLNRKECDQCGCILPNVSQ